MIEHSILLKIHSPSLAGSTISQLRQEYQTQQKMFSQQPVYIQQQLESQAALLTDALVSHAKHARYELPEAVFNPNTNRGAQIIQVPGQIRRQVLGGLINRWFHFDLQAALDEQLTRLEHAADPAITVTASLLRYSLVMHMVHQYLPDGKSVQYSVEEGDEIPCNPIYELVEPQSGFHGAMDAAVRQTEGLTETNQGSEKLSEYASQGFFLPEWVVIDDQQHLLAGDLQEANAKFDAMQQYLSVLNAAVELAPYMVVDEVYQGKRYGIVGQLVNQGRALANYQVELLCETIKQRSAAHKLDRGLSLSIPYFNDQILKMETYRLDVIPVGWVMFVPAFVVLSVRAQAEKVAQDTRLSQSTRRNLLNELCILERAFLR